MFFKRFKDLQSWDRLSKNRPLYPYTWYPRNLLEISSVLTNEWSIAEQRKSSRSWRKFRTSDPLDEEIRCKKHEEEHQYCTDVQQEDAGNELLCNRHAAVDGKAVFCGTNQRSANKRAIVLSMLYLLATKIFYTSAMQTVAYLKIYRI